MSILTFKYLRDLQKNERDSPTLQKIDATFYAACSKCLDSDSTESETMRPLVKSILDTRERKIVTAALHSARADIKPENLLSEEEALFSKMSELLKINRILIGDVLSGKYIDFEHLKQSENFESLKIADKKHNDFHDFEASKSNQTVQKAEVLENNDAKCTPSDAGIAKELLKIKALSDIPAFVAEDMKSYGPLAAGQTAEFPKKAAEVLITAKMAEKTE